MSSLYTTAHRIRHFAAIKGPEKVFTNHCRGPDRAFRQVCVYIFGQQLSNQVISDLDISPTGSLDLM